MNNELSKLYFVRFANHFHVKEGYAPTAAIYPEAEFLDES
jgi:hypothetical protein